MTGTEDAEIFSIISRVELTRPPGVLISISTAWSLRRRASSMARAMYSALMGWIVSLTTTFIISADTGNEKRTAVAMQRIRRNFELFMIDEECIGPSLRSR